MTGAFNVKRAVRISALLFRVAVLENESRPTDQSEARIQQGGTDF